MSVALVKESKVCEDCGGDGVPHGFTYFNIWLGETLDSVFKPKKRKGVISNAMHRFEHWISVPFLEAFVLIGLAKKQKRPDDGTLLLARCLWEEADARGIEMYEWRLFGLPRNILVARFPRGIGGKRQKAIAFEGIPAASYERDRVEWIDDKARLKEEFSATGLPVARGGSVSSPKQALKLYRSLTPPVIVKPRSGSGSRHTVLHITDEAELIRAFRVAKQVSPQVVLEEELEGPVYRATVVNGKFVAAIRRDPPHVVGDGVHTVAELVEEANKHPARSGPYFSKIELNEKAEKELAWQGVALTDVPAKGLFIYFHQKVNWSVGGTTADVTDEVHPDNQALFEKAAQILHAPITGIDFIIKNISSSWKEQKRCGILECNSMPFFDNHHLPFEGKPRNVAAAIWDMVTPI
jgi:D-alanine-D-alanine ligase-like ATP-grasp enzyme